MGRETYCSWCGKENATKRCPCRRVNYCDDECMRAARADHRLACTASKPTSNERKPGAIVRISGLQSDAGRKMNGLRAEILELLETTGRIRVALTLDRRIKIVAIKLENLALELSVLDAVKQSMRLEKEAQQRAERGEPPRDVTGFVPGAERIAERLPNMSGKEIVRRIRIDDQAVIKALCMERLSCAKTYEMHEHGLIDALLDSFTYPEAIDVKTGVKTASWLRLTALSNLLSGNGPDSIPEKTNEMLVVAILQMGPTILTLCSKKRR